MPWSRAGVLAATASLIAACGVASGAVFHAVELKRGATVNVGPKPDALLWVVALGGEIYPEFGVTPQAPFTWAEYWYTADAGDPVAMGGNRGPGWPPDFDAIQDLVG